MSDSELSIVFAGPLVTFQDAGRFGKMRYGVSASGPMDRLAFDAAHAALGNEPGLTAIEVSLGGLSLVCARGCISVAITGGDFIVEHEGQKTNSWTVLTLTQGEKLSIRAGKEGSWAYLAFAGRLKVDGWLGSQATHTTSGFGGSSVRSGQSLVIFDAGTREERLGEIPSPGFATAGPVRVVAGPQDQYFSKDTFTKFASAKYVVTEAYDRMGMRLNGPKLNFEDALSIPSEPIVRGSVQVSGDGVPTVLLADHQTTGGYPKIATIISCDTDRLAQFRAGQSLHFMPISSKQAVDEVRQYNALKTEYIGRISVPRGTFEQRLMRENLIHGYIHE